MRTGRGDPSSIRWRLAATVGPELVALALAILFALVVLLVIRVGSPTGNDENRSADPSSGPRSSGSTSMIEMAEVGASSTWSWLVEIDRTRPPIGL